MFGKIIKALIIPLFLIFLCMPVLAQETAMGVKIGDKAPDFSLIDLQTQK